MKRTKQCPKCGSVRIGHIPEQPDADDVIARPDHPALDPSLPAVGAASTVAMRTLGISIDSVETGTWRYGRTKPMLGRLEAYVCTECGYHETYVASPRDVPWEKVSGFAWVNPSNDGPYR